MFISDISQLRTYVFITLSPVTIVINILHSSLMTVEEYASLEDKTLHGRMPLSAHCLPHYKLRT